MQHMAPTKAPGPTTRRRPSRSNQSIQSPRPTILLSVAGLTPQVITETLYCLMNYKPPVPIREIRVVTTRIGAERVRDLLLDPRHGHFHRFCHEFRVPPGSIRFESSGIIVPEDADGKPLEDVRTPADNAAVADCILSLVRDLTKDPETSLHCSVAGGRKTMGLFLGMAFQLFGRPQDRLSHVLVWPPEIEGQREFFYPPPQQKSYRVGGKTIRSSDVRVELAEIPVLLLREGIRRVGLQSESYTTLIARAQAEMDRLAVPPRLILDSPSRSLRIDREVVALTALEFAVYHLLARRRAERCGKPSCPGCQACSLDGKQFLDAVVVDEMRSTILRLGARDERTRALAGWRSSAHERFLEVRSKLNSKIHAALGSGRWVDRYCISTHRVARGATRYFIPADPDQILIG